MVFDLLIIEDDLDVSKSICKLVEDEGLSYVTAENSQQVFDIFQKSTPRVLLIDILLMDSEYNGLEIMDLVKKDHPGIPCIVMSGHASVNPEEMKKHAYDYIQKPFRAHQILATIKNAISHVQLNKEHENLLQSLNQDIKIIFSSPKWERIKSKITKIAATDGRVLILGPKGSGRELVARNIHALSEEKDKEFITFSPRSFHDGEIERKLFSGDDSCFKRAKGGTLFINEVQYLPIRVQEAFAHLLSNQVLNSDFGSFRLITSGSQDLPELVTEGTFRGDLYNRISSISIEVPHLYESRSDIPNLCEHMIKSLAVVNGVEPVTFSEGAMAVMQNYDWPGNLNQFRNVVEHALISCSISGSKTVTEDKVSAGLCSTSRNLNFSESFLSFPIKKARELFEKQYIEMQLDRFGKSVSKAAKFMEMERTALYRKLKDLGIPLAKNDERKD